MVLCLVGKVHGGGVLCKSPKSSKCPQRTYVTQMIFPWVEKAQNVKRAHEGKRGTNMGWARAGASHWRRQMGCIRGHEAIFKIT